MGDYTRLDETIMVLIAAKAERKGAAVGFRMMISPEGRAIAGLKQTCIPLTSGGEGGPSSSNFGGGGRMIPPDSLEGHMEVIFPP